MLYIGRGGAEIKMIDMEDLDEKLSIFALKQILLNLSKLYVYNSIGVCYIAWY